MSSHLTKRQVSWLLRLLDEVKHDAARRADKRRGLLELNEVGAHQYGGGLSVERAYLQNDLKRQEHKLKMCDEVARRLEAMK